MHYVATVFAYWPGRLYLHNDAGPLGADTAQKERPSERGSSVAARRPRHALTKSCKHPPKIKEEFTEFPGDLELVDVPAGSYWVPSQASHEEVAIDQHTDSVLAIFLESGRFAQAQQAPLPERRGPNAV